MELKELYAKKGELVTQLDILQAQANVIGEELKKLNQAIGQELQKAQQAKVNVQSINQTGGITAEIVKGKKDDKP